MLNGSAASTDVTDGQCSPNTIVWSFDTYMMAQSQGGSMVTAGGKSWFFITADYVFGHIAGRADGGVVKKAGGEVKGTLRYPFPETTDFSSYLSAGAGSGAKVLGLANAGPDTVNSIKQAHEFGAQQAMKIAPLLIFITDVHSLGLQISRRPDVTDIVLLGPTTTGRAPSPNACCRRWRTAPTRTWRTPAYSMTLHLPEDGGGDGCGGRKEERDARRWHG